MSVMCTLAGTQNDAMFNITILTTKRFVFTLGSLILTSIDTLPQPLISELTYRNILQEDHVCILQVSSGSSRNDKTRFRKPPKCDHHIIMFMCHMVSFFFFPLQIMT